MTIEGTGVLPGASEERGSWPTGRSVLLALLPLVAFLSIALALEGRSDLVLPPAQVIWFVLGPLVLAYPVVAALSRVNAYAPTTVLVVASLAPAIVLAARLLLEPLERDARGKAIVDLTVLQDRALPPGIVAVALFIAIEVATAGMRRGAVLGIAASLVAIAIVGGAAAAVLQLTGTTLPRLS
jgi:hypothetical protein